MRRKALFADRPKSTDHEIVPTSEIPELDESIFTARVDPDKVPTLEQIIKQPLCGTGPLYPLRLKINARRTVRCVESDQCLYRGEYGPSVVKARFQSLAGDFIPDLRISRSIELTPDQWSSIFLRITNFSSAPMDVVVQGEYINDA
jgi:hypothetical protein